MLRYRASILFQCCLWTHRSCLTAIPRGPGRPATITSKSGVDPSEAFSVPSGALRPLLAPPLGTQALLSESLDSIFDSSPRLRPDLVRRGSSERQNHKPAVISPSLLLSRPFVRTGPQWRLWDVLRRTFGIQRAPHSSHRGCCWSLWGALAHPKDPQDHVPPWTNKL